MTVRNMTEDYEIVCSFLSAKIAPRDLKKCFEFLLANGNRPNDVQAIITLYATGIKDQQLIDCRQFVLDKPNDVNLLVELYQAIKTTKSDFKGYFEFWTAKGASAELYQTLIQFARAGARPAHFDFYLQMIALRGPNPQDHAKGEDITLLVKFTESGCANEKIEAIF